MNPFSSWKMWGDGKKNKNKDLVCNGSSVNSLTNSECSYALMKKSKKVRKEETKIDREFDVVFVPSDVDDWFLLSGYDDSDDSDWSIGWLEPLGSDFESNDDDSDDSFAVLVPCYSPGCKEVEGSNSVILSVIKNLSNGFSSDGKSYMEHWLASLQNFRA